MNEVLITITEIGKEKSIPMCNEEVDADAIVAVYADTIVAIDKITKMNIS